MLIPFAFNPAAVDRGIVLTQVASTAVYDSTADVVKTSALLLAVFLPAIGAIFTLVREMRKPPPGSATVGKEGMAVIAGGIVAQENGKLYIEQFERVVYAIDKLTQSQTATAEAYELAAKRWNAIIDEAEGVRRALEEVVILMKRSRETDHRR